MNDAEYAQLVRRAEALAERSPAGYRTRVVLLGALGYFYVWFLLLLAVGALALLVAGLVSSGRGYVAARLARELALPIVIFVGILARALWVKLEAPRGLRLERREYPALFAALDDIRSAVKGPKLDQVLLDDQFNASITQIPRLGVFGWHRNYLILGLPLMQALTPGQLLAVLAHEYGHLSGAHGKLGTWTYRVRVTWMRLLQAFEEQRAAGAGLVRRFFQWYAPYFSAYSFAMARSNEYEADRVAASFAGARDAGGALMRLHTVGGYLSRDYWPALYAKADRTPAPSERPYALLGGGVGLAISQEREAKLLDEALQIATDLSDTHPSLSDRLRSLGVEPVLPPKEGPSAAEAFLGPRLDEVVREIDERWQAQATPWWQGRYDFVQNARLRLRELSEGPEAERTVEELLERARLVDDLNGREQALPLYHRVLERDPEVAVAACIVGLSKLAEGDEADGLDMIERAVERDPSLALSVKQAVRDHYAVAGDMAKAQAHHDELIVMAEERQRIQAERSRIPFKKVYEPHGLPDEVVAELERALRADSFVKHAWLARKPTDDGGPPVYVVGITGGMTIGLGSDRLKKAQRIADSVDLGLEIYFLVLEGDNKKLKGILAKVPGSKLF